MSDREISPDSPERRISILATGLTILGCVGIVGLALTWFGTYVHIFGDGPEITVASPISRQYLAFAIASVALFVVAIVLASIGRLRRARTVAIWLLVVAVIGAVVFEVPAGRWIPQPGPAVHQLNGSDCQGNPSLPGCGG